jgi:glycosyltransferase involved in cell wall biosynthesis
LNGDTRPVRRLLMVANAFPPMASGGNARQLRFIRYLPEFGWEVTVLSARVEGPAPEPDGVRIERAAAPNPESLYGLARRMGAQARRAERLARGRRQAAPQPADVPGGGPAPATDVAAPAETPAPAAHASMQPGTPQAAANGTTTAPPRGKQRRFSRRGALNDWLFVPDEYAAWIVPAVRLGRRLLESEPYDAILSSFPRPSTEVIASQLARDSGLPWLADYRDPWATRHLRHYPTALHRRAHYSLEEWALRPAAAVTATNRPIADSLLKRFPPLRGRVHVLPNGFDPLEEPAEVEPLGDGFWLVHTGRLYGRSEQLQRVLRAFAALPPDVKLLFVGIEGSQVREEAARLGVGDRVRTVPFVPHAVALGYQRAASGLVLITGNAPEALSSKVFEYLVAGRPIFAFVPTASAAHALLEEAGGAVCAPQDEPPDEYLRRFVEQARGGAIAAPDAAVVARFDGRELTRRLAGYLDCIVDQAAAQRQNAAEDRRHEHRRPERDMGGDTGRAT